MQQHFYLILMLYLQIYIDEVTWNYAKANPEVLIPKFAELSGRCSDKFPELFVEVAQVIESAIVRDIQNIQVCI